MNTFNHELYKDEVKKRWGNTKAYKECKDKNIKDNDSDGMFSIFKQIGELKELDYSDKKVQELIFALQKFISDHYYTCTNEILLGLGTMYVEDERFKHNIEEVAGEGTDTFIKDAITVYCTKK